MKTKKSATLVLTLATCWLIAAVPCLAEPEPRLLSPFLALEAPLRPMGKAAASSAEASTGKLFNGALIGGTLGLLAGGAAGLLPAIKDCDQGGEDAGFCAASWVALGGGIGGGVGVPLGVHLANGRRGNLALSILTSMAIAGAGVAASAALDNGTATGVIMLGAVPVSQFVTTIAIERKTARLRKK